MKIPRLLPRLAVKPAAWLLGSASVMTLVATFNPPCGLAADPDGNKVSTLWWQYLEAGTYPKTVKIINPNCLDTVMLMPRDAVRGQTIHLILQVTDDGTPPLTRYQRIVVTCR